MHGDFAPWNVHYEQDRLAGVIDFALTHLDSRPYELAIARTYRAPQAVQAYRAELAVGGWPLSELEETAIEPVYRAFRVAMAAWEKSAAGSQEITTSPRSSGSSQEPERQRPDRQARPSRRCGRRRPSTRRAGLDQNRH